MCEVLAPAGDFSTALAAFDGGADAVYLGLENFSARKRAKNFSFTSLQRLLFLAHANNKKVFVTINTLIFDSEFNELNETLSKIHLIGVDAVIVQDLGVLKFIRTYYPDLEVHASTQMAIHNVAGALMAQELGITRVVLSRETSLKTIEAIRRKVPDMELEVFIHGALCYSFSGMCFASGLMVNRSGNRGECAQICRNYFDSERGKAFNFSCNDLVLGSDVIKLKNLGVHSFKIEGRMKSPRYAFEVSKYYRELLNNKPSSIDRALLSFSRMPTKGYFFNSHGEGLINTKYSGHVGILAGKVEKTNGRYVQVKLERAIKSFDSLSIFRAGAFVAGVKPGPLFINRKRVDGAKVGDVISLDVEGRIEVGDEVRLLGVSEKSEGGIDEKAYPLKKKMIPVQFIIGSDSLSMKSSEVEVELSANLSEAQNELDVKSIVSKQCEQTGDSTFGLTLESVSNMSDFNNPFVPQSLVKKLKKMMIEKLESSVKLPQIQYSESPLKGLKQGPELRSSLSLNDGFPFTQDHMDLHMDLFSRWDNKVVIPLAPVLFDEEEYYDRLDQLIKSSDDEFLLGINNISHLYQSRRWKDQKNVSFYVDFYFYLSNHFALQFLNDFGLPLIFAYQWCEKDVDLEGTTKITDRDKLPLFYSMGCYKSHNASNCENCSKQLEEELVNNKTVLSVRVKRCHTYLFLK